MPASNTQALCVYLADLDDSSREQAFDYLRRLQKENSELLENVILVNLRDTTNEELKEMHNKNPTMPWGRAF